MTTAIAFPLAAVAKSLRRATATSMETSAMISDFIHVEQLEISARVGVTDEERSQAQRLTVSMTLWPRRPLVDLGDDVRNTINYSEVCDATKEFTDDCSCRLIETLADLLAMHLLKQFAIQKIAVEIRKFVRPDTTFVAVTVTRSASRS
jgi:7,8-dihydroneopterin aldolase/epimerase/oxygenase